MGTLEIKNISYTYKGGTKPVINDVSCDFEKGKLYAVIGPSGSGKSTLLSLMAGLDKPSSGTIDLEGKNIFDMDLDAYRRQSIAMIFQNFQLLTEHLYLDCPSDFLLLTKPAAMYLYKTPGPTGALFVHHRYIL